MRASAPAWGRAACVEANGDRVSGCSGEGNRLIPASACGGGDARRLGIGGVVVLSIVLVTYARRAQAIKMRKMCYTCAGGIGRRVGWGAAGGVGRAPLEVVAHLVQKDHQSSNLGRVPLHGALGVSRGAMLLYCCATRRHNHALRSYCTNRCTARACSSVSIRRRGKSHPHQYYDHKDMLMMR